MTRITTLLAGTAMAAALAFGAQTPAAPATDHPATATTTKKHVKKHRKAKKDAAATTAASPSTGAGAPAGTPAKK